jgi:hypothetical protein
MSAHKESGQELSKDLSEDLSKNGDGGFGRPLSGTFLCRAYIVLDGGVPLVIGPSPWRNRRVGNVGGGTVEGTRLRGEVLRSGADWSEGGTAEDGTITTAIDVRMVWRTHDDVLIYVTYNGRMIVPPDVVDRFINPDTVETLGPDDYYFRINPIFETSAPQYDWLNRTIAIGLGQRTAAGVTYHISTVD